MAVRRQRRHERACCAAWALGLFARHWKPRAGSMTTAFMLAVRTVRWPCLANWPVAGCVRDATHAKSEVVRGARPWPLPDDGYGPEQGVGPVVAIAREIDLDLHNATSRRRLPAYAVARRAALVSARALRTWPRGARGCGARGAAARPNHHGPAAHGAAGPRIRNSARALGSPRASSASTRGPGSI